MTTPITLIGGPADGKVVDSRGAMAILVPIWTETHDQAYTEWHMRRSLAEVLGDDEEIPDPPAAPYAKYPVDEDAPVARYTETVGQA